MIKGLRRQFLAAVLMAAGSGASASYAATPDPVARGYEVSEDGLHLVLNVAGNWLYVYENGERTRTYSVSVGLPGYETPPGEYNIGHINWNPWWRPPDSEWARGRTAEPPGSPTNPMGRVKIHFAPLLYIHGTPESEALGYPASRGCVRMRNDDAIELARLIHSYASPRLQQSTLDELVASPTRDRTINLSQPVRFTAHYEVATVENGFLVIYPDIYGLVPNQLRDQVELALEQHGVDLRRVNQEHLERLLNKGATRRVVIAMDDLVPGWRPGRTTSPQR
ncbi:MAG TPA: L,D-transpeptidase [Longimicrobiales bacterium]|nr:L,D-transpeptidase [Longimicrobiales bacterium]